MLLLPSRSLILLFIHDFFGPSALVFSFLRVFFLPSDSPHTTTVFQGKPVFLHSFIIFWQDNINAQKEMFCEPPLNFNSSTFLAQVSQSCIMPVIESCEEDKGCGKVPKESLRASREIMNDLTSTAAENARFPKNIILFPMKLRRLLDDAVEEGNEHIISWLPNGKAFKIHDSDAFTDVILKRYFRQTRFKSFTRQL